MYIKDIAKNITANTKIFVDDTKVKDKIEKEEDVENLQKNLDELFASARKQQHDVQWHQISTPQIWPR